MVLILYGCGAKARLRDIQSRELSAGISIPLREDITDLGIPDITSDTLVLTDLDGNPLTLMKAVQDEQSGEMIATQSLQAAVVTARFQNIAERGGEVEIEFDITIPKVLQDEKWQIRFHPRMMISGEEESLDEVRITGKEYRQAQLRGYEQYNKYISSIITDPDELLYTNLLKIFISRNIPELAILENDSSFVEEMSVRGLYDVTYNQVKDYYTKIVKSAINEKKIKNRDKAFNKYVKDPIAVSGIKIDSILKNKEEITFRYSQAIKARPCLKKVELVIDGSIYMDGKEMYKMPESTPISFYISSLSSFAEEKTVYVQKVVERKAEANSAAYISFPSGKSELIKDLYSNKIEIERISSHINDVILNEEFDLDSLVITASCSPEGNYQSNAVLALKRAGSIKEYFTSVIENLKSEQVRKEKIMVINHNISEEETAEIKKERIPMEIITRSIPEEWDKLYSLIESDTLVKEKKAILECFNIENLDLREKKVRTYSDYDYIRKQIYPKLRSVRFDFFLHRKGMVKDTVHTTEVDTLYQKGILALKSRDYEEAVKLLMPYSDFNTALAYSSLDRNLSALSILEKLPQSAKRDYLMAILYSRRGEEKKALQSYMNSISQDHSMAHRGNLDPEVSMLIKKYKINYE